MPSNEIARVILKTALARATAGAEGALKVGSQLPGVAGSTVQAILASLKGMIGETRSQILTSDAEVSWGVTGASYLKWDSYIYLEPVPTAITPDSWIGSMMPSSVLHTAGGERKNANGIFINTIEELWMIHPRGTGSENCTFEVVTYDSARQNELFNDPNAYLICYRDQSTNLRFTNGTIIPHGTKVDRLARPYASTEQPGLVEMATENEHWDSTNETRALTGKGLYQIRAYLEDFTNEARNNILSGGGTIKWAVDQANRVKWDQRFILLPSDAEASSQRYIDVNFPGSALDPQGTERVNGNGILLGGWESLWCIVPRNDAGGIYWRVASYLDQSPLNNLYSDEGSYLICVHNNDTATLNFRNGLILPYGKQSIGGAPPTSPHVLLSTAHSDIDATDSPVAGEVLTYDTDNKWRSLPVGAATMPDASTSTKGRTRMSTAPADPAQPIAVGDNDARMLTSGENDAAQGTNGTPSNTNRFVTNSDPRNSDARTPTDASVTPAKMSEFNKGVILCTSSSRPSAPVAVGQIASETDTGLTIKNVGTSAAPVWRHMDKRAAIDTANRNTPWNNTTDYMTPELAHRMNADGYFYARRNAVQALTTTYTYYAIAYNEELIDLAGWFDPATGRYTVQRDGIYHFDLYTLCSKGGWGYWAFGVSKNGTTDRLIMDDSDANGAAPGANAQNYSYFGISMSGNLSLAAGDYVVGFAYSPTSGVSVSAGSWIQGYRIGDRP